MSHLTFIIQRVALTGYTKSYVHDLPTIAINKETFLKIFWDILKESILNYTL